MTQCNLLLDNIIFSLQKAGGISLYWYELNKGMHAEHADVIRISYTGADENLYHSRLEAIEGTAGIMVTTPVALARFLPYRKRIDTPSIFHSSYFRYSTSSKAANIVTVYDFTYEKYLNTIKRKPHLWQKRQALAKADGIICISESTKKDLLQLYPHTGPKKIEVIPLGVSASFCLTKELPANLNISAIIKNNYIVYVGTRVAYKNFRIAIEVLRELPDFDFVIVGGDHLHIKEKKELDTHLAKRYRHFPGISETHLNVLYNNAFCLLYPSSYEGFGLPLVEAMSAGCPVVAVNTSSIPEVCGSSGLLVETPTVAALVEKICLLKDMGYRRNVVAKGIDQAKKFTWQRCIQQTQEFYSDVFERSFGISLS